MHLGEQDLAGWAELRAWLDDDRLGVHVRLLLNAYDRDDRSAVRGQAMRLLVDVPPDFSAARNLLSRLRDRRPVSTFQSWQRRRGKLEDEFAGCGHVPVHSPPPRLR